MGGVSTATLSALLAGKIGEARAGGPAVQTICGEGPPGILSVQRMNPPTWMLPQLNICQFIKQPPDRSRLQTRPVAELCSHLRAHLARRTECLRSPPLPGRGWHMLC